MVQRLAARSPQGWLLIALHALVYAVLGIVMLGALVDHAETVVERLTVLADVALTMRVALSLRERVG